MGQGNFEGRRVNVQFDNDQIIFIVFLFQHGKGIECVSFFNAHTGIDPMIGRLQMTWNELIHFLGIKVFNLIGINVIKFESKLSKEIHNLPHGIGRSGKLGRGTHIKQDNAGGGFQFFTHGTEIVDQVFGVENVATFAGTKVGMTHRGQERLYPSTAVGAGQLIGFAKVGILDVASPGIEFEVLANALMEMRSHIGNAIFLNPIVLFDIFPVIDNFFSILLQLIVNGGFMRIIPNLASFAGSRIIFRFVTQFHSMIVQVLFHHGGGVNVWIAVNVLDRVILQFAGKRSEHSRSTRLRLVHDPVQPHHTSSHQQTNGAHGQALGGFAQGQLGLAAFGSNIGGFDGFHGAGLRPTSEK
mmetsp:Transcript_8665/g.18010  ORF Transcript_8665/g.18010 Transcript_8665/m.18010 type:complete len:356 (-) Transcript_8665:70-1137(-)